MKLSSSIRSEFEAKFLVLSRKLLTAEYDQHIHIEIFQCVDFEHAMKKAEDFIVDAVDFAKKEGIVSPMVPVLVSLQLKALVEEIEREEAEKETSKGKESDVNRWWR